MLSERSGQDYLILAGFGRNKLTVEGVADGSNRRGDGAEFREVLGVPNRRVLAVFNRSSQHRQREVFDGLQQHAKARARYRGQIVSPGRPTVAWREDRVRFWAAIGEGKKTRESGAAAGVSEPVAHRWFRNAGGVNPQLPPKVSGDARLASVRT